MRVFLALLFSVLTAGISAEEPLSFGKHYLKALKGEAVGTSVGFVVGAAGYGITKEPGSLLILTPLGNTLGTAMGANLATEEDERNGSLLASWTGAVLGGVAIGGGLNYLMDRSGSQSGVGSGAAVGLGLIGWSLGSPLVSTAFQRWFRSDDAPEVSLWSPSGDPHREMGLRMSWRLP